jgi:spermidine/putrescine transport system permease protein
VHALLVYLFLYIPIAIVIFFSFNNSRLVTQWEGFSLRWYVDLWNDRVMQAAIENSLIAGVCATVIATVIGTLAALGMSGGALAEKRVASPFNRATGLLLLSPVIVPEIVVGAATLTFFAALRWHLTLVTVVIAHVTFSISYVAIVVRARLAGFDRSLEEAAMDLGATRWSMFWRVKLPLMAPGIVAAALLVFTLSIDDYVITSFVAGPQSTTLPLLIASKLRVKSDLPVVNAAATVLLVVTILLILIAQRLMRDGNAVGRRQ